MTKEELKVRVCAEIDRQADRIMGISKHILAHPEIGFCETKTASYVADQFADMGLRYRSGLASSASTLCSDPGSVVLPTSNGPRCLVGASRGTARRTATGSSCPECIAVDIVPIGPRRASYENSGHSVSSRSLLSSEEVFHSDRQVSYSPARCMVHGIPDSGRRGDRCDLTDTFGANAGEDGVRLVDKFDLQVADVCIHSDLILGDIVVEEATITRINLTCLAKRRADPPDEPAIDPGWSRCGD